MSLHLVYLNTHYQNDLADPASVLMKYRTMTHWCEALQQIDGVKVSVVQRFSCDSEFSDKGIDYYFVNDGYRPNLLPWRIPVRTIKTVAQLQPDLVHTGGKQFIVSNLRPMLPRAAAIVWQHHGGGIPRPYARWLYRHGFEDVDAFFFTAKEQATPWIHHSLIQSQHVFEVLEGSTTLMPLPYAECQKMLGITSSPTFLFVGHLNANKDPLTVIKGFALSTRDIPHAHLFLAYGSHDLLPQVNSFISENNFGEKIHLLGTLSQKELQVWYSASDYFILGSHREGSGYALLEAMACGVTPIVTNIPSFRQITGHGTFGSLWTPGEPESLRKAICETVRLPAKRLSMRSYFEDHLSFGALASTAFNAYTTVHDARRRRLTQ